MAYEEIHTGMAQPTSRISITSRPPRRSVHTPKGRRNNAPDSTGVAVNRPNCVESSPSSLRMGMPVTPNINHTAKQTVKANVLTISTRMPTTSVIFVAPWSHR